jgi:uncharacterized protein YlxW (UPF0749 family)
MLRGVSSILAASLTALVVILTAKAIAEANSAPREIRTESTQDLLAKLNPQQKQQFEEAARAFTEPRFTDSLVIH